MLRQQIRIDLQRAITPQHVSCTIKFSSPILFVFFLMLLPKELLAQDAANGPILKCEEQEESLQTNLMIRDPQSPTEWLRLVEFSFPKIGWQNEIDSCRAWVISTLEAGGISWGKIRPVRLLASKTNEARLALADASEIYRACSESDRCSLKIPYRWHWSLWRDVFYKKTRTLPEYCYASPETIDPTKLPPADLQKQIYPNLGYISSWREPGSNLATEILKMTENMNNETVVISTMQWSPSQLQRLKEHFATRNIKAFIIGDLNVWLSGSTRKPSELTKFSDEHFIIIPAYRTPKHTSSHHIKGAITANKAGDFLFTSSNLTSGDDSVFHEFGIHGQNADFSGDWLAVIRDLVGDYCDQRKLLSCMLPSHVQQNDIFNLEIEETLARGCRDFFADRHLRTIYSDRQDKNRLIRAGQDNLEETILKFLASAKTSIKATVNQINRSKIINRFQSIDTIPIKLYIGSNLDSQEIIKQRELRHIKTPKKLPHTKAILIDQKALFWGTGNFTANGLDSLREIFFITSDLAVIKAFENYYTEINNSSKDN